MLLGDRVTKFCWGGGDDLEFALKEVSSGIAMVRGDEVNIEVSRGTGLPDVGGSTGGDTKAVNACEDNIAGGHKVFQLSSNS